MAIHTKKRDRVALTPSSSFLPSAKASFYRQSALSATEQEEEYQRAVAFLREFHSRRVVDSSEGDENGAPASAAFLQTTNLEAISEGSNANDHFEEMLANDFTLALTVTKRRSLAGQTQQRRPASTALMLASLNPENSNKTVALKRKESFLRVVADVPPRDGLGGSGSGGHYHSQPRLRRSPGSLSRMKKTSTMQNLSDLSGRSSPSTRQNSEWKFSSSFDLRRSQQATVSPRSPSPRTVSPTPSAASLEEETDFYLGGCHEEASLLNPRMTKRHRSGLYLSSQQVG
eukprot:CAMPEP_0183716552 /NCGR_PEP_ID=MMETSP0737-20130205/10425_1 /TAXON_ID=385413 /ORGANISM="Thalassiosira miniscula, Strain CCMP1093" /LENGTH=286 /DNA_ID=CAMNT_0025945841 /DNA_START=509 /DNA_END=1369 /DNA_ORIENTATION=-